MVIIIKVANPGVQAHTLDNFLGVQPFHLGVSIQLVEVADPQG